MSVQRRDAGGKRRYRVRWREGGRMRSQTFDAKVDADSFDAAMRRRRQLGAHAPAQPSADHVKHWLEHWFARDSSTWARSTRIQRAGVLDKWVEPYLGG